MSTRHKRTGAAEQDHSDCYVFAPSFGQERLWFLAHLEPDSDVAYNVATAVEISGPLDPLAFQRALDSVLARHESLRTGVALIGGEPRQIVLPETVLAVPVVDCSGVPPAERQATVAGRLARESGRRFALDEPPLLRIVLLKFGERDHVLLLVIHHIVCDGWSIGVFLEELAAAYRSVTTGATPPAETPLQYADYAAWQRETVSGARLAELTGYWTERLADLAPLEIPTDRPRPAIRSAHGRTCRERLPAELVAALTRLAGKHRATLFMVLLAGWKLLLSRYAGQRDLAVGTAVANRTRPELDRVIGLFVNTLVLRTDLRDVTTFGDLLTRVRETCLGAYAHQDLPFEKVVEAVRPARDLSRTPLFQAMLLMQNTPAQRITVDQLTFAPLRTEGGTAKFDLTLEATPDGSELDLALHHSADLFEPGTAERMLRQLVRLLRGVADSPDGPVAGYDLLGADDRRLVEHAWAYGPVRDVPAGPLPALVRAQAARTPDAVAVESDDERVSYAELTARVDRLARLLRDSGVRPGDFVGVCVERSVSLVAALLAVLTAEAAYVPIDPGYPAERISHMLSDAGVQLVLSSSLAAGCLPSGDWKQIHLDRVEDIPGGPGGEVVSGTADRPAYVIYTSGSTGLPKGVQIGQQSLVNVLLAMAAELRAGPGDALAAVASVSFDIAALELFMPLLVGGRVVVVPESSVADGPQLADRLARSGVTIMQATPATWRLLLMAGWQPSPGLRIVCTGEALDAELAGRLRAGGAPLWNLYGPTEATLYATAGRIDDPQRIGLGDPVPNSVRYVLDDALRPVPIGTVGELYLGGVTLGYGYLGQAAQTAARFLPDPFAGTPGARMYRTSDLCRYRSDGTLDYLGRADQQIKVRGFRIEPGEIEAVLARHPDATQVAVIARTADAADVRLVAYAVVRPETGRGPDTDVRIVQELRELARRELPTQLVPSLYVLLDRLPLTPSGKLDRAALRRDFPADLAPQAVDDTPPRTDVEREVAAIFAEVLGVERVGVHASFFDLGGHSLLAAKFANRLAERTGVSLQLRELFHRPTVAAVAEVVMAGKAGNGSDREAAALKALLDELPDSEVEALLRRADDRKRT